MSNQLVRTAAVALSIALAAPAAFSVPVAVLEDTAFDFGFVPQHAKISHVFRIQSGGDDTLRIVQVIPGCGCTKAPLEDSVLAPGESTGLEVVFSTGVYTGRMLKHPRFVTNETNPDHQLEFLSTVVTRPDSTYPLIIQPAIVDFGTAGDASPQTMTVQIKNASDVAVNLSLIDWPQGMLEVTLPNSIPAGGSAEATVRVVKKTRSDVFEKSFTIQVGDAKTTRFTVPVRRTEPAVSPEAAASAGH